MSKRVFNISHLETFCGQMIPNIRDGGSHPIPESCSSLYRFPYPFILNFQIVDRKILSATTNLDAYARRNSAPATAPVIVKVDKGSWAEGAGLKAGDVVSELARISVRDMSDLSNRMGRLLVGDVADFKVVRDGKPMFIRATITDIRSK